MNRLANAQWHPGPDPVSGLRTAARVAVVACAGMGATAYLAGVLFLWSVHLDSLKATPLTVVRYAVYFGRRPVVHRHLLGSLGASVVLIGALGIALIIPKRRTLYGDAGFATRTEIRRAGFLGGEGLILGKVGSRLLMLPGQQSVILAAPPRSGKDVGVVVPNGLNWPGSLVQVDIKRENWALTAGFRQRHGQACFRFEPLETGGDTARWNPLSYVSDSAGRRINDIQRIADILYAESPGTDPFWIASARSLFVGIALYLYETPSWPKTIGEVRRHGMASDDEGFGAHWKRIVEGRQRGRSPLSAECVRALYDVIDLAPVTASSVRKTFTSRLDLWANPLLDEATSADDFDLRDLRRRPISIYVCVNPDDLHRLQPILSLFFQQLIGLQTQELPEHNPELVHQVLLLLNEFTALGKIPIVSQAMAYMPGYNVRILLVIQAPSQLREVYGMHNAETMLKSVAARIVFSPKDYPDAKEISDELGITTVRVRSKSRPSPFSFARRSAREVSTTESEQPRALMLPQEVKELGPDEALIFYEGVRPIRCQKIRYYADRRFQKRLLSPPKSAKPLAIRPNSPERPASEVGPVLHALAEVEMLTLEDLDVELQHLTFARTDGRPTDEQIDADVTRFLKTLREP